MIFSKFKQTLLAGVLFGLSLSSFASSNVCDPPVSREGLPAVKATVLYVDAREGMITLRHEGVPVLDLPSNTGAYQVSDDGLLPAFQTGQQGWVTFIRRKTHVVIVDWLASSCK